MAPVVTLPDGAVLFGWLRRQAHGAAGLAGSLTLHVAAALAIVLMARTGAPPPPADPWIVEVVVEQAPAAAPGARPAPVVSTGQLALDLPMPDEGPPIELGALSEPVSEPPSPEPPRRKPAAPRSAAPAPQVSPPGTAEPTSSAIVPAPPAETTAPASAPPAAPRSASGYGSILLAWLERYRDYPRSARLRRQEGEVLLRLTIDRAGRLLAAEIAKSSGFTLLDQAAIDTARRAAPLPPLPPEAAEDRAVLLVPVLFALAER